MNEDFLRIRGQLLRWIPASAPGKSRFARLILGNIRQARDIRIEDRFGCAFFVPSLQEPIAFYLLIDGVYEPLASKFVANYLRPGSTFVDIGANIGVFAIPAGKRVGASGRVIAVEPSPLIAGYLRRNIESNDLSNVRVKTCAAYDRNGLCLPFYEAPIDHFGMGALAAQFNARSVDVVARTLDIILAEDGINHVDLLKVDVEGFEAAVFRGAKSLFTCRHPPVILFEFCDWAEQRAPGVEVGEAQQVILDFGYSVWRLANFVRGQSRLSHVLTKGCEALIAIKPQVD